MIGTVILKKYGNYIVNVDGVLYNASIRGTLKLKDHVYVGDEVVLSDSNYIIENVLDRKSLLKRPQISNIDQIVLVFSLVEPDFSYFLAFKYLTYANYNEVPAIIVLSKGDKANDKLYEEIKATFNKLNVPVYLTSSKTLEGIKEIRDLFKDKKSVLVGQSGVGKSSLLNAINPDYEREVGEYSLALGRGKHKTKEIILLPYSGGYIADTPGFSSLDLELTKLEIAHYFPGFKDLYLSCFYSNCLHIKEKECKILKAVSEGIIPSIAYENYLKLLQEGEGK